ncbi:MAG: hypothetical protein ABGY41_18600, partial [Candidatus Poribacteria bacterium]
GPTQTEMLEALYGLATGPAGGTYASDGRITRALEPVVGAEVLGDILDMRGTIREVESLLASETRERAQVERDLEVARGDVAAAGTQVEREQEHSREVEEWFADSEQALENARVELAQARGLVAAIESNLATVLETHESLTGELVTIRAGQARAEEERDEHARRADDLEADIEKLRGRIPALEEEARKMLEERAARRKLEEALKESVAARDAADKNTRGLEFEAQRLRTDGAEATEATERAAELDALLAMAEEEREEAVRERAKAVKRVERVEAEAADLREEVASLTVKIDTLEEAAAEVAAEGAKVDDEPATEEPRRGWLGRRR